MNNNINLIIGNHGSGKSSYIYDYFFKNCKNADGTLDLNKRFYLVVPEQDTQDKQDTLIKLATAQKNGIINIDVISFDRLCYMVSSELNINMNKENVIDDDIKRLVLRLAMQNLEKKGVDFVYFKNMKNKVGFTDKLKSAMSELYSYNIDKEIIDDVLEKSNNERLKSKISELSLIYEEFKLILKEKNFSIQEDKLNLLYKIIDKSHICDDAIFAFDGFTGFTPIQNNIFSKICEKSKEVYVSIDIREVDVDNVIKNFGYKGINELKENDVFYLSKTFINQVFDVALSQQKMINKINIIDLCKSNKILYDIKKDKYYGKNDLAFLERNLYINSNEKYKNKIENISVHKCKDIESEVDFLINKIQYLRRVENYRLNDIKVVVPTLSDYSNVLIKKCEENKINLYIDNNKSIYNSPIIEAVRSMFDVILYNFNYDSIMRYIKCGLFDDEKQNKIIYLLDNAIRKYGLKGHRKYKTTLETAKRKIVNNDVKNAKRIYSNVEENIDEIIKKKNEIILPLIELYENLSKTKEKYTINEYIEKIEVYLENAKIYEKFENILNSFNKENNIDYLIMKDNMNLLKDIFEKIKIISAEDNEKISFYDFRDLFNVTIENKTVSIVPFSMEELECGDLMRSRFDNPKVVFFLGLNESAVPAKTKDNNIIDDDMRVYLKNVANVVLSQTTKETSLNQRFYVYLALTNATDKLFLSYTSKNSVMVNDYPSIILLKICKMFEISDENELKKSGKTNDEIIEIKNKNKLIHIENKEEYELYTLKDMVEFLYKNLYESKVFINNIYNDKITKDEIENKKSYNRMLTTFFATKKVYKYLKSVLKENEFVDVVKNNFDTTKNINKNIVKEIIGEDYVSTVTKLEDFATCPYKYFLDFTIKLSEREKYEIDNRTIGNLFHKVLENIFDEEHFDITKCDIKEIESLTKKSIENIIKEDNKFLDTNYAMFLTDRLQDIIVYSLTRLQENLGINNCMHIASEESLLYNIEDSNDKLKGKIDTVDNYVDGDDKSNYIRIVDYKSSNKEFNEAELKAGINIQFIVYLDYALKNFEKICDNNKKQIDNSFSTEPVGAFYYQIHDDIKCLTRDEIEEEKLEEAKENYKYKGIVNEEGLNYIDKEALIDKKKNITSKVVSGKVQTKTEIENTIKEVNENIKKNIKLIKEGNIVASPYSNLDKSCNYCPYEVVCKKNLYPRVEEDVDVVDNANQEVHDENNQNDENDENNESNDND